MTDKSRRDLTILSAALLLLLFATVGVVLYWGKEHSRTETQEPRRVRKWRKELAHLLDKQRYSEAEIVVKRILAAAPEDVEMLRTAGKVCYRNQKYTEARHFLGIVIRMEPENYAARCNYALALAGTGQNGQALAELKRVLRDSGNAGFVFRIYEALGAKSNYTVEMPETEEIAEIDPEEELLDLPVQKKGAEP